MAKPLTTERAQLGAQRAPGGGGGVRTGQGRGGARGARLRGGGVGREQGRGGARGPGRGRMTPPLGRRGERARQHSGGTPLAKGYSRRRVLDNLTAYGFLSAALVCFALFSWWPIVKGV